MSDYFYLDNKWPSIVDLALEEFYKEMNREALEMKL
jgi:hypothetical protein